MSEPHNGAPDGEAKPRFRPRPWIHLETVQDVELWIDEHNQSLQQNIGPQETGYGVCFTLAVGGNIYMHTGADAIMLDVDADARWVAPLIVAATGAEDPGTDYWTLRDDTLVQLLIGLSTLVESTTLVVGHRFGSRNRKMGYA
ncbi:MAG: hypothetical protein ACXW2U_16345 [Telluria sp.]